MLYSVFFSSFLWNGLIFGSKSRVKYKYHKASTVVIVVAVVVVLFTQVCWSVLYSRLYLLYWKRLYLVVVIKAVDCDATAHSSNNVSVSFFLFCGKSYLIVSVAPQTLKFLRQKYEFSSAQKYLCSPMYFHYINGYLQPSKNEEKRFFFQFMNDFDAFFVCRFAFGGNFS